MGRKLFQPGPHHLWAGPCGPKPSKASMTYVQARPLRVRAKPGLAPGPEEKKVYFKFFLHWLTSMPEKKIAEAYHTHTHKDLEGALMMMFNS